MRGRTQIKSNMSEQNTQRGAATAASDSIAEGEAGAVPGLVICPICQKGPLKGAIGLSQHQRRAHPEEYHAQHQVSQRVKPRWLPEESERMARYEADLIVSGVLPALINRRLVEVFGGWSLDRIKGQRKRQDYKLKVQECIASARALKCLSESDDSQDETSTEECRRSDWRREILTVAGEELRQYRDECGANPLVDTLLEAVGLAEEETEGGLTDARMLLDRTAVQLTTLLKSHPRRTEKSKPRKGPKAGKAPGPGKPNRQAGVKTETEPEASCQSHGIR